MIPKVNDRGHSFKGVFAYLLHDKEATTSERVAWSETGNMATNDASKAWKIMAWTDRNRDFIRAENGTSAAGSKGAAGNVYHYSLSWAIGEEPEPEHQRMQALDTLGRLGLSEHEYALIAHNDTDHNHVHVVANLVNPQTGRIHTPSFDKRELQRWALDYEREHGLHCLMREENARKREAGEQAKYRAQKQDYSASITRAYHASDNGRSFVQALKDEGLSLCAARRGSGFVVVDQKGDVQKLARQLDIDEKGRAKTDAINAKLADLERGKLPDADALSRQRREQDKADPKAGSVSQDFKGAAGEKEGVDPQKSEPSDHRKPPSPPPEIWDRERAEIEVQERIIDAAIEHEKKRQAEQQAKVRAAQEKARRERAASKDSQAKKQAEFAAELDKKRAAEQAAQRRRDELQKRLDQTYDLAGVQRALRDAERKVFQSDSLFGRLSGKLAAAREEVAALRKTLENIRQREAEQRGALEQRLRDDRKRPDQERKAPAPSPTPSKVQEKPSSARELVDKFERSATPVNDNKGREPPSQVRKVAEASKSDKSARDLMDRFDRVSEFERDMRERRDQDKNLDQNRRGKGRDFDIGR